MNVTAHPINSADTSGRLVLKSDDGCGPHNQCDDCQLYGVATEAYLHPQYHVRDERCAVSDPDFPFWDARHRLYHLFYQFHPGSGPKPKHDPVIGHVASRDLVRWVRLPVAMWNGTNADGQPSWWDRRSIWTGSATIVNGTPWLIYPGVCQPHVDPGCSESGFSYAQAVPADLNDPYLRTWRKMPPIVNDTFGEHINSPRLSVQLAFTNSNEAAPRRRPVHWLAH